MRRRCILILILAIASATYLPAAQDAPKIDKTRLESYVRYTESFGDEVKVSIDDPVPSPFAGFFRVLVHLSRNSSKIDRLYYVTADGAHFIDGSIWDLNQNPFLDTLAHLPADGPSFGPLNAKVTIVVFSDFQCPYCREFARTIRENIPAKYPKDVRVIFKDFPIDSIHKWARSAAEAGACIAAQNPNAFWAFHDSIFDHQQEVNDANVNEKAVSIAKDQNLDLAKLSKCISTHATAEQIDKSLEAGRALQIRETPTFFVNGRTVSGANSWPELDALIQRELDRPKNIPGPNCCIVSMSSSTRRDR